MNDEHVNSIEIDKDFQDYLEKKSLKSQEKAAEFSLLTSKWLFLINGAALTSVIALIAQLSDKNKTLALSFLDCASSFQIGLLCILLSVMIKPLMFSRRSRHYLSLIDHGYFKVKSWDATFEIIIAILEIISFLAFIYGFTIFIRTAQAILS